MATQFEFYLVGADAPEGQLRAPDLLAIVHGLTGVAARLGRTSTSAEDVGRAPHRVHRVADLTIGLQLGSSTLLARRASAAQALDFDVDDEQEFDLRFGDLIEAIGANQRPEWVDDSLGRAVGVLAGALKATAPEVDFTVDGAPRHRFKTAGVTPETWRAERAETTERSGSWAGCSPSIC